MKIIYYQSINNTYCYHNLIVTEYNIIVYAAVTPRLKTHFEVVNDTSCSECRELQRDVLSPTVSTTVGLHVKVLIV